MHGSWRLAAGLAVLFVSGCQSYPPPYGYGYQGNYPVPTGGTYVQPGATFVPQGTMSAPATAPAATWQQPKNAAPNSGQLSGTATPTSAGANKLVPEYAEPDAAAATLNSPR